jgi:CDP-diacylglycerol--serine O-phosphatidyltransferase
MEKKFIGSYNKSVILTYAGMVFSIIGGFQLLNRNAFESIDRFEIAYICLILAGICDLFDGFVARKCKRSDMDKAFGVQIDSFVDVVSFLIFPSIIFNETIKTYLPQYLDYSYWVIIIYTLCGIIRLAWFNINTEELALKNTTVTYYQGLPVTYISFFLPILYSIHKIIGFDEAMFSILAGLVLLVSGFFFIFNIKIKKPKGVWYAAFSIAAIIVIAIIACI